MNETVIYFERSSRTFARIPKTELGDQCTRVRAVGIDSPVFMERGPEPLGEDLLTDQERNQSIRAFLCLHGPAWREVTPGEIARAIYSTPRLIQQSAAWQRRAAPKFSLNDHSTLGWIFSEGRPAE